MESNVSFSLGVHSVALMMPVESLQGIEIAPGHFDLTSHEKSLYSFLHQRFQHIVCRQIFSDTWIVLLRESSRSDLLLDRVA